MRGLINFIKIKLIEYKKIKSSNINKDIKKYWFFSWFIYTFLYPAVRIFLKKDKAITFCEKRLRPPKPSVVDGVKLQDKEDWDIFIEVFLRDVYRKDLLKDDMIVLDIGAHIGIYSILASRKANKVISVEPFIKNYDKLKDNVKNIDNIETKEIALSDKEGKTSFYVSRFSFSHSLKEDIVKESGSYYKTESMVSTVDNLLKEMKIDKVDLIKIDAEGSELNILKGSENTLRNNKRLIIIAASYHYPEEKREVVNFLEDRGFKIDSDEADIIVAKR